MTKQMFKNYQSVLLSMILLLSFTTLAFAEGGGRYSSDDAWSFGVMADTQWTLSSSTNPDPNPNPNYVAADTAIALEEEFIDHGVKFVIQLGDLTDRAGDAAMYTRAEAAQPLYDAGIGFFPIRGNHETYGSLYGLDPNNDLNIPAFLDAFPQTQGLDNTFGATNFSSPSDVMTGVDQLDGLSYAFDYNNATFVAVDVEQSYVSVLEAPYNPQSCVEAVTPGTPEGTTPFCGQGYMYLLNMWLYGYNTGFVVYQAAYDITNGVTTIYDSAANPAEVDVPITITEGTWFRIDSSGRPSTDWKTWNEENPDQMWGGAPFDIVCPVADPFNRVLQITSASGTEIWPDDQQDWISARLDQATRGTTHAFTLSHRNLMGANHVDSMFGSNPGSKGATQNVFYDSLESNGVHYHLSAHDHLHNRSYLESPDGLSHVEQLISMAASSKFYQPASTASFAGAYGDVKQRETIISQEVNNHGYYIYNVDGPRVLVEYYSDAVGGFQDGLNYPDGTGSLKRPDYDFVKKETWGYSLNGQQYLIAQGDPYTSIEGTYGTTTARILDGTNNSTTTDLTPETRPLTKVVNTAWMDNPGVSVRSDIFSLVGMGELGTAPDMTDTYVLEMSTTVLFPYSYIVPGRVGIATYVNGEWVNAASENFGGTPTFKFGPYQPGYDLGTWGFDPATKTFWVVLNYQADFSVSLMDSIRY